MSGIGLVLAGGGGKGAYQIGVWKALEEYGVAPNVKAISGTSVGALNAVLFAQGDLDLARKVWSTISPEAVMTINQSPPYQQLVDLVSALPENLKVYGVLRSIHRWLTKQWADQGLLSKEGLSRLIDKSIQFQRVCAFGGPIYAAAYHISSKKLKYFDLQNCDSSEQMKERLLASASIPVVFGMTYVDGDLYWDGGTPVVGDNVPVKPLYDDGVRNLIVVHLGREEPVDRDRFPGCNIIEIMPQEDLGGLISGTMNFKPEVAKMNMERGYNDTVRILEPLDKTGRSLNKIERAFQAISEEQRRFARQNSRIKKEIAHSGEDIDAILREVRGEDNLMRLQLPYDDHELEVSQEDKAAIEELVSKSLAEFKGRKADLEMLTLECVSKVSNSSALSSELEEQGTLQRLWRELTGKNRRLKNSLYRGTATTQYAYQQMLVRLIEQNATAMDFIVDVHKESHTLTLEIEQEQLATNRRLAEACQCLLEQKNAIVKLDEEHGHLSGELDRVAFICPRCKTIVSRTDRVCHHCGHIIVDREPSLLTAAGRARWKDDLEVTSAAIREAQEAQAMAKSKTNKTEQYRRKASKIRRYLDKADLPADIRKKALAKCAEFERFLEKEHIEVAIAGTVKAGKSTLINALLGTDFAVVNSTPETSVLAKYRTTSGESYIKVRFYSEKAWQKVWEGVKRSDIYVKEFGALKAEEEKSKWVGRKDYINFVSENSELQAELRRFTGSQSPIHFFVRDVEVGIHSSLFPSEVFLVDTPGLDDVVEARSRVTREYLGKADAVLACVKEKELHEASEARFISRVMSNRAQESGWRTLFVVATQKDLDAPDDYDKNRAYFIQNVLDSMFHLDAGTSVPAKGKRKKHGAEQRFFGVSAAMYAYALVFEQKFTSGEDLDDWKNWRAFWSMLINWEFLKPCGENEETVYQQLDQIKEHSGIPRLRRCLEERIFKNARETLYKKTEEAFQNFQTQLQDIVGEETARYAIRLDVSEGNMEDLAENRKQIEEETKLIAKLTDVVDSLKKALEEGK